MEGLGGSVRATETNAMAATKFSVAGLRGLARATTRLADARAAGPGALRTFTARLRPLTDQVLPAVDACGLKLMSEGTIACEEENAIAGEGGFTLVRITTGLPITLRITIDHFAQ